MLALLAFTRAGTRRFAAACLPLFLLACGAPAADTSDAASPPLAQDDGGGAGDVAPPDRDADQGPDAAEPPDAGEAGKPPEPPDAADAGEAADGSEPPDAAEDAGDIDASDAAAWDAADAEDAAPPDDVDASDAGGLDASNASDAADAGTVGAGDDAGEIDAADAADASPGEVDAAGDAADASSGPSDQDGDGVPDALDCAPNDANRWQLLSYAYRDADGDGRTVPAPAGASVCSGASLPSGYANIPGGPDCNDASASVWAAMEGYPDVDGDGVGVSPVQHLCTDGHLPAGYAPQGEDCAPSDASRFQLLGYGYRDADHDGHTVVSAGTICSGETLPPGYLTEPSGDDCNDTDPSVWGTLTLYVDVDGDGVGAGPPVALCLAASPKGYATVGGDCAETDATRWAMLQYWYRDADGDGWTRAESGTVCSGATLPAGYALIPSGDDCDDTNPKVYVNVPLYVDSDGDGAGAGDAVVQCLGDSDPPGYSEVAGDCAPSDPTKYYAAVYSYIDHDGDGATVPASGSVCGDGTLAPPYYATARGLDCDDDDPLVDHYAPGYKDTDSDGFGTGPSIALCLGKTMLAGYSQYGTDEDDSNPAVTEDPDPDDLDLLF